MGIIRTRVVVVVVVVRSIETLLAQIGKEKNEVCFCLSVFLCFCSVLLKERELFL